MLPLPRPASALGSVPPWDSEGCLVEREPAVESRQWLAQGKGMKIIADFYIARHYSHNIMELL